MIKTDFSYTDEFDQKTSLVKTHFNTSSPDLEILIEDFKLLLLASGFTQETVDRVKLEEY